MSKEVSKGRRKRELKKCKQKKIILNATESNKKKGMSKFIAD